MKLNISKTGYFIILACFMLLTTASIASAWSISGYVYYTTSPGDYATAAKVELYSGQNCDPDSLISSTCINANHYYIFTGLSNGTYSVKVPKAIRWPTGKNLHHSPCYTVVISGANATLDPIASIGWIINCLYSNCTGCPNYE